MYNKQGVIFLFKQILKKIFNKIAIILNYIFAFFLLLAYISVYISPSKIPFLAIFGLFYPFFLLFNLFFFVLLIYQKKKHFLISLFAILIGILHFFNFFSFNDKNKNTISNNNLKIMTYNVRMFDFYNWSGDKKTKNKIFELIKNENADIICLQEFYSNNKYNWKNKIIEAQKSLGYITSYKNKNSFYGNAIFSRFPIYRHGFVRMGTGKKKCIFADIIKGKDTIRVYSIHLASIHLDRNDYKFIKNIKVKNGEKNLQGLKGIGGKLVQAYRNRSVEVDAIYPHIADSPYKTIVCGDFNDTPISYSYQKIKGNLKDVFNQTGFGIGNTYVGKLSLFRIDFILHNKQFKAVNSRVIKKNLSDHFPIVATLNL